jgi:ribonuclease HI
MGFYAVANGRTKGIFTDWNSCLESVKGYKNALYKKFKSEEEAKTYIESQSILSENPSTPLSTLPIDEFVPDYYVYTDGSCFNNGKENAYAGIGIFFDLNDPRNVSKRIHGKQTNNTAELSAIIETYSIIEEDIRNGKKVAIVSDSEYVLKCVSSYGKKCEEKNWNTEIPNKELVKKAYQIYKTNPNIRFIHVKAHTNKNDVHSVGNAHADSLANQALGLESCPYNKNKIYVNVSYSEKEEIKKLGGLWDGNTKKWFIYENNEKKDEIMAMYSKEY